MINLDKKVNLYSKNQYLNLYTNLDKKNEILTPNVGDTIGITLKDNDKVQNYKGIVIAKKGNNLNKTITIRFISHNIGVNFTFFINSINILDLKILKTTKIRRSKLYYIKKLTERELTKVFF